MVALGEVVLLVILPVVQDMLVVLGQLIRGIPVELEIHSLVDTHVEVEVGQLRSVMTPVHTVIQMVGQGSKLI
jgi:hypothetical protein